MRLRRYLLLAAVFLLVPLAALVVVGILVLAFSRASVDITFGVLILSFCAALLVGTVLLVISLKHAADVSRLQTDLLSKVSHEFKTPLTGIRMFVETLSGSRVLSREQREKCLTMLHQETERLDTIIERWLDFGRMEAGKMVYERRPEPIAAVVDSAVQAFRNIAPDGEVELATDVPPDLPMVLADRALLSQALLNLLHNAYKYGGDPKRIQLVCGTEKNRVALSVRDNGPGIPRRERRRIFQRFYRIDDRLSRRQQGTGLGLAIARHVVQAHGGKIRVRNRPEGGADFSILLPAV